MTLELREPEGDRSRRTKNIIQEDSTWKGGKRTLEKFTNQTMKQRGNEREERKHF